MSMSDEPGWKENFGEYLVVYGWAVLVVLVALLLLWWVGVFDTTNFIGG